VLTGLICLFVLIGIKIGGETGGVVGLIAGTAIAIGGLLYWASRPT